MSSDYPIILQIVPIPKSSTKLRHARVQGIVTSLTELGYDSIVCTYAHAKEVQGAENLYTTSKQKNIQTHKQLEKDAFATHLQLLKLGLKIFRNNTPMAIHTYGLRGLKISALIKLLFFWKRSRLICDFSEEESNQLNTISRFSLTGFLVKMANVVTCSTQSSLEITQEALGLDPTNISLVVNGIDSNKELNNDNVDNIKEKLKIAPGKTVIAINGGIEKSTSTLKELQKIIFSFKEQMDKVHFLIIGEPRKYLYSFLKKYEIDSMCTLASDVQPKLLPKYYSVANLALSLDQSDSEENRVTILNYMGNCLPIVCYETQNQRNYLPQGTPLANSITDINSNLKNLIQSSENQEKLSRLNMKRFEEFYSWEVSKEQLHATYMQTLDE